MSRHWMFSSGAEMVVGAFDADGRIALDAGPYRGYLDHLPVSRGLSLFRAEGRAEAAYTLEAAGGEPVDNLVLGCMLSGTGVLEADGSADQHWRESGQLYGVSLAQRQVRYHLQPNEPFRSVALMLTPEGLDLIAQDNDLPALVRGRRGPVSVMRPLGPQARRAAQDLLHPHYHGRMGRLFRQARASELLALQLDLLGEVETARHGLTSREVRQVREARQRLLADLRDPPDLAGLAAAVGLRPKRLNQGFRQLFGTTVFDYLLEARLTAARDMLDQGLDMPLKQMAWDLGYGQASNFISAFRRRFGVSPGAYRQRQR